MSTFEAVVVGAGPAGIAAARRLAGHGLTVQVMEARDRIGGRALTIEREGLALDMGCGWLHSADDNPLRALAPTLGFTVDETGPPWGRQAFDLEFSPADQADFGRAFAAFDARVAAAAMDGAPDRPCSDLFEAGCRWNPLLSAVSTFLNGAEFEKVSLHDYAAYVDTEANHRVVEGYGTLVAALARGLPVATGCAVTRIEHGGAHVRLHTTRGVVEARAAVVTVPPSVMGAGGLVFDPPLPSHLDAADRIRLGLADKLHLRLDGEEAFEADSQLFGRTDTAETGAYHLRPFGRPLIEAFVGGDLAWALDREGPAAFEAFAVDQLASLLGSGIRRRLSGLSTSRWGADPWSLGAYSYAVPGGAEGRESLAAPVGDRLFFAGEHTSVPFFGTAHGAWIEGGRAAEEALDVLGVARREIEG